MRYPFSLAAVAGKRLLGWTLNPPFSFFTYTGDQHSGGIDGKAFVGGHRCSRNWIGSAR